MSRKNASLASPRTMVIASLGIVVNIVLGTIVHGLQIPLIFLDTIGTIFVAALLGPIAGAATGGLTNIIRGILLSPTEIPFGIVNIIVGSIVGLIASRWKFNIKTAIITGIVLAIMAPLIGAPIAAFLFDGVTGGGTDLVLAWLRASGQRLLPSVFISRVMGNFIDKIVSCILAAFLLEAIPKNVQFRKDIKNI